MSKGGGPYEFCGEDFVESKHKGKDPSCYEWWKMWLGHIELWVTKEQLSEFIMHCTGTRPKHINLLKCNRSASSSGENTDVGLNSAFVEFMTLGRL
jgi:hypothetical protein